MNLNENRMLKLAGILKEDIKLNELEFATQKAFDTYKKTHKMRPDTQVKVAGKSTTVAQASKQSPSAGSVFGGNSKMKPDTKAKAAGKSTTATQSNKQSSPKDSTSGGNALLSKKYAKLPKGTMALRSNIDADGERNGINTEVTYDYYRMKSGENDMFMSRKQSKALSKALRGNSKQKIDGDKNKAGDNFDSISVKPTKNGFDIKIGNENISISSKQAKELRKDIRDSF